MNMLENLLSSFSLGFLINLYDDIDDNISFKNKFSDVYIELFKILIIYLLLVSPLNHSLIILFVTIMVIACWITDYFFYIKLEKQSINETSFYKAACIFIIPFLMGKLYFSQYNFKDILKNPIFMIILLMWPIMVGWEQVYFPEENSKNKFNSRIFFTVLILIYLFLYFYFNSYIIYIFNYVNMNADLFLYFCYLCLGYFISWLLIRTVFKESFSNNKEFDEDQKSKVERKGKSKVERKEKSKVERKKIKS